MKTIKMFFLSLLMVTGVGVVSVPGAWAAPGVAREQEKDQADKEDTIEPVRLRLPFRITEGVYRFKHLSKADVQLVINDRPREIKELAEHENSIGKRGELGRSLILSFHVAEYNKKVADAVSYFVTEVLIYSDMLFVITPIHVYRFDVSRNKLKLVGDIETLVKKDIEDFNARRLQVQQEMENQVMTLRWSINNPYQLPGPVFATIQFSKNFLPAFKNFSREFWLPDVGKFQRVFDFLKLREGERWCIHFQQQDMFDILSGIKKLPPLLKTFFTSEFEMTEIIKSSILTFERELSLMDSYAVQPLLDPIQGANFNFNTVFFGSQAQTTAAAGNTGSFYLENILTQTSLNTGGKVVNTSDPLQGIREIIGHKDHYYEVLFDFNGDIEEENIKIIIEGSKTKPSFKEKFSLEEMQNWLHELSKGVLKIENISTAANEKEKVISFALKSFEIRDPLANDIIGKKFGILQVRIQVHNQWGDRVYSSERLLRVTEDIVTITHSLPLKYQGKFILNISVMDLIRNGSISYTGDITL